MLDVKPKMNMCMFQANLGARDLTSADYTDGSMKPPAKIPRKVSTQKSENSVVLKSRQALKKLPFGNRSQLQYCAFFCAYLSLCTSIGSDSEEVSVL